MRKEGVLLLAEGESMLDREDIAEEEGDLTSGSRLGVDMFVARAIRLFVFVYSSKDGNTVEVGTSPQLKLPAGQIFVTLSSSDQMACEPM